ncbi:MAG TPA: dihydropteroate synthase [Chloroflexota bacterium]|nr:dihydropteroate synthase [Chloroflexota bacterium]
MRARVAGSEQVFRWGEWGHRTYVMGVGNCTPDSFSGDGLLTEQEAVTQGLRMVEEGADVLDVGGESTKPGAEPAGAEEQRRRIIPVIEVLVDAVADALATRFAEVIEAGVARNRVLVDPGIGFGKAPRQSLALLRHLGRLHEHQELAEIPLMVGTSRKGFIGETLGLPVDQRLEGTLATLALAVAGGAAVVRVHDVQAAVRCCRMARRHRASKWVSQ